MDLRQLRYFLEIVEQGSLSRAAARLNVAQPSLSIHLRNMEDALGTELLTRMRSGVEPTEAGEALARHARMMLREQAKAEDEIRSLGKEPTGEVRVGLPGTISEIVTVPLIEITKERFPRVRVTVSEAMSGFVAEWLREGRIDLALLYAASPNADVDCVRLLDEELVALAAPGQLSGRCISFAALSRMRLILPSKPHGLRSMIETTARRHRVTIEPEIEVDSYKSIKTLVAKSHGVSILPYHAVVAESQTGELDTLPFEEPRLRRSTFLVSRNTTPMKRATRAVHDLLCTLVTSLVREGKWAGAALPDIMPIDSKFDAT